jgi:hypothetical protein
VGGGLSFDAKDGVPGYTPSFSIVIPWLAVQDKELSCSEDSKFRSMRGATVDLQIRTPTCIFSAANNSTPFFVLLMVALPGGDQPEGVADNDRYRGDSSGTTLTTTVCLLFKRQ